MSYSIIYPCFNCSKAGNKEGEGKCTDLLKIEEAVSKIHLTTDGSHQGAGSIVLACYRQNLK